MKQEHRSRDKTQHLILHYIAQQELATRTQIARALGRTKTPHLITIIDDLVERGYLLRDVKTFANGVQGYLYRINPDGPDIQAP
jgi:DNA-binding MarR family transcriptional regulator